MSNRSFLCRMDRFILKFLLILQAYLASSVYQRGYLLPGRRIRENVSYRDSSAIRETFLTNFCTNLVDCFDMFLLHSDRQTSTFNGLQTTMLSCAGKCS